MLKYYCVSWVLDYSHFVILQALQEFTGLCETEDVEKIKSVLPFWPRIYSKVSVVSRNITCQLEDPIWLSYWGKINWGGLHVI